jgi:uncharacterized protein (TIGR04255 family)
MGEWTFANPNPITAFTVGLVLERPLPPPVIREISGLHGRFKRELPRRVEQQALTFQMGAFPPQNPNPQLGGVMFDSLLPDGNTRAALSVNQAVITYMVAEYTRWVEFWPVAERLLTEIATVALREVPIRGFILVANNRFQCPSRDVNVAALIKRNPTYVVPHILVCRAPSQSIHGYAIRQDDPPGERTDNILCRLSSDDETSFVDLSFILHLRLDAEVTNSGSLGEAAGGRRPLLERALDMLHEANKNLFARSYSN